MERDIDCIIAAVQTSLPQVQIRQRQKVHPADDDGIWWFSLPDVSQDVQLESSLGNCPFLVETNEQDCKDALKATSVQEAVAMIVDYLTAAKAGCPARLHGSLYWQDGGG